MASRRRVLSCISLSIAAWSGCLESTSLSQETTRETTTPATEREFSHHEENPAATKIRRQGLKPAATTTQFEPAEKWIRTEWVLNSGEDIASLDFAFDTKESDTAKEFLQNTEMAEESVVAHQYVVDRCQTRQLNSVKWEFNESSSRTSVELRYEITENDCGEQTSKNVELTFVRIPTSIESLGYFGSFVQ